MIGNAFDQKHLNIVLKNCFIQALYLVEKSNEGKEKSLYQR